MGTWMLSSAEVLNTESKREVAVSVSVSDSGLLVLCLPLCLDLNITFKSVFQLLNCILSIASNIGLNCILKILCSA